MIEIEFNENLSNKKRAAILADLEESKELPTFKSQKKADEFFIHHKKEELAFFTDFIKSNQFFEPTFTPESLKKLESLYYDLYEQEKFGEEFISIEKFELYMHLYFGEVIVLNIPGFKWGAEKHYLSDSSYYLAIKSKYYSKWMSRLENHYATKNNQRRNSLFRKFNTEKKIATS